MGQKQGQLEQRYRPEIMGQGQMKRTMYLQSASRKRAACLRHTKCSTSTVEAALRIDGKQVPHRRKEMGSWGAAGHTHLAHARQKKRSLHSPPSCLLRMLQQRQRGATASRLRAAPTCGSAAARRPGRPGTRAGSAALNSGGGWVGGWVAGRGAALGAVLGTVASS